MLSVMYYVCVADDLASGDDGPGDVNYLQYVGNSVQAVSLSVLSLDFVYISPGADKYREGQCVPFLAPHRVLPEPVCTSKHSAWTEGRTWVSHHQSSHVRGTER